MTFKIDDLGPYPDAPGYPEAVELDEKTSLADRSERFAPTEPDLIYLDGNSLGRLPARAVEISEDVVATQWGSRLIRSWNEGWWDLQTKMGDLLAPILGAGPGEVIISDSTSVNLYKLAHAALTARPDRSKIVTDDLNFPTDIYVLEGLARQMGRSLQVVDSDGVHGPVSALAEAIDEETALVSLSHTAFKSGYTYDMGSVTALAHRVGAFMLWDCSHSAGSVPVDLGGSGADLAVGCTYKYLNGGPGSPAFLYVRSDLQESLQNPITAWWGHAEPFAFDLTFQPAAGIRRFHAGTMPIVSLALAEAGIEEIAAVGMDVIRERSISLGEYLVSLWSAHLEPLGFDLASPRDPHLRGSHISLRHDMAWPITRALIDVMKVIPDFRAPDNIRLGLSPLYTKHVDIHTAVHRLIELIANGIHLAFTEARATVT